MHVFTDGSKVQGATSVGVAVVCPQKNTHIIKSISPHASIFTAECLALKMALDMATQDNDDKDVYIYSDSLSSLLGLQSLSITAKKSNLIMDIQRKYFQYRTNPDHHNIFFCWIPSHIGIWKRISRCRSQRRHCAIQ